MIFEEFAFMGIVISLLAAMSIFGKTIFPGFFGVTLLLFLSFWVMSDGIQYPISVQTQTNQTIISACPALCENATTTESATTTIALTTTNYQDITWPFDSILEFKWFFALFLFFLGLAGITGYALQSK